MFNHMQLDVKLLFYKPMVAKLLCCVMGAILLLQFVLAMIDLFTQNKTIANSLNHGVTAKPVMKQPNLQGMLQTAFFGDYVPKNINDGEVKQSMLDMKVVGIMFAQQEENSNAVIKVADGEEKTYRLGDELPGNAIIKKITPNLVLILRKGTLESLGLSKNNLKFEVAPKPLLTTH